MLTKSFILTFGESKIGAGFIKNKYFPWRTELTLRLEILYIRCIWMKIC